MADAINLLGLDVYLTANTSATSITGLTKTHYSNLSGYDSKTNSFVTYYDMSSDGNGFAKKVGTVQDCGQVQLTIPIENAGDMSVIEAIDANPAHNGVMFIKYSAAQAALLEKDGIYANVILTQKTMNEVNENGYTGAQIQFEVSGSWKELGGSSSTSTT